MTELDKLSRRQLARMVEVLRGALHDVEAVDYPYYPETRRICGESLSLSDRIAAEPVELTDAEVVDEWLSRDGHLEPEIALTNRSVSVAFDSLAEAATWIRTQGASK